MSRASSGWGVALSLLAAAGGGLARAEGGFERSVVRILCHSQEPDWYTPWNAPGTTSGTGSGFVVDGGRVMTNAHVVANHRMIILYLHGDPTPHPARLVAVGHDCDLALLEPEEAGLLDAVPAVEFGGLPAPHSTVETYGYPAGGRRISSTRGVVSRIEVKLYVHSGFDSHLTVQTDAAINPGNSGGPVVQDGLVVGVAFQGPPDLDNVGFIIPTEVIHHFLRDVEDGAYDGFPDLGLLTSNMENPAARRKAGMPNGANGVRVEFVYPTASGDGVLREGDVILSIAGFDIANDGTVAIDDLRLDYNVVSDRYQVGERVPLDVWRRNERVSVEVLMAGDSPLIRYGEVYDQLPRYVVHAGLVFAPLNRETLVREQHLMYEFFYRPREEPEQYRGESVILLRKLDHPVNADMAWYRYLVVDRVNGHEINELEDLIDAFDSNEGRFHVLEFRYFGRFGVLDREAAEPAHAEILERYGVPADRRL